MTPRSRNVENACVSTLLRSPFHTWWAIILPLLAAVAFAIGIAATRTPATRNAMRDVARRDLHPVG